MNKHNTIQVLLCHTLQTVSIKDHYVISFSTKPQNTETRQLTWNSNKMTDLYIYNTRPHEKVFPNRLY